MEVVEDGKEFFGGVRRPVLHSRRVLVVGLAVEQAGVGQVREPSRERVRGDVEVVLDVAEPERPAGGRELLEDGQGVSRPEEVEEVRERPLGAVAFLTIERRPQLAGPVTGHSLPQFRPTRWFTHTLTTGARVKTASFGSSTPPRTRKGGHCSRFGQPTRLQHLNAHGHYSDPVTIRMGETFYSLLGVSPDADTATIRAAYREKVKTHHPDVSDESDAAERFQRITEARDVLVDDADRKRYDRMGHDAYVRRQLDSTAWSASDASSGRTRRGGGTDRRNRSDRSNRATDTEESTEANRRRSGRGTRDRSGSGTGADRSGERTTQGTSDRTNDQTSGRKSDRTNERQGSDPRSTASDASTGQGTGDRAAWMGEDGWSTSGDTTATASGGPRGARAADWQKQHAASNVYSPTGRDAGVGPASEASRFARLARGVGPWIVFHFVFLVSAFVTAYLLLSSWPTLPAMFGSLLLLGGAVFFSVLHMVSRMYS